MIRSILIGLTAGARALTPLAAVSSAAGQGDLPDVRPAWLGSRAAGVAIKLLAAGELWGDKLKSAPDRIVPAGIAARLVTGALAGAALAPPRRAGLGAAAGALAAVGAAYVTFHLRMKALRRFGQTTTGFIEDALTVTACELVVASARRRRR